MRNINISMVGRSTYNWLYSRYLLSGLLTLPNALYQPLCSRIENNQHITVVTILDFRPQMACIHVIMATMEWHIFCLGSRHSVDLRIFSRSISTSFLHPPAKLFFFPPDSSQPYLGNQLEFGLICFKLWFLILEIRFADINLMMELQKMWRE